MRRFGNYIETDTGLSGYEPLVVLGRELEELSTVVLPHFWQQPRRGVRRLARVVAGNGAVSVKRRSPVWRNWQTQHTQNVPPSGIPVQVRGQGLSVWRPSQVAAGENPSERMTD